MNMVSSPNPKDNQFTTLDDRHYIELKASGITDQVIEDNFWTISDNSEVDRLLNRNSGHRWKHSDLAPGWAVCGVDPMSGEQSFKGVQFKPDTPRIGQNGRPTKYESASGQEQAPLFLDANFSWAELAKDLRISIAECEGAKKAAALLSIGQSAISHAGVTTGQKKGRLRKELTPFYKPGRTVCLVYDADWRTNLNVLYGMRQQGRLIKAAGADVRVICWDTKKGKGIDDYLTSFPECDRRVEWERLCENALTYEEWLVNASEIADALKSAQPKEPKVKAVRDRGLPYRINSKTGEVYPAPQSEVAAYLAEEYRDVLAWNPELESFFRYKPETPGLWTREHDAVISQAVILSALNSSPVANEYTDSYTTGVLNLLRKSLVATQWDEAKGLLPFKNGVLDIKTGELLEHSPGYRFTWQMPREHNTLATDWSNIEAWLDEATQGDQHSKTMLLCFANAVLKGRYDLQMFMHLTGKPRSGKGTYTRLVSALIGQQNIHSTTLEDWCNDRFEPGNAYGKRLVVFADEDRYGGKVSKFKSLTGGDSLRGEQKYSRAFPFVFEGMVLLCSNDPIFSGNRAIESRSIMVPFDRACPSGQRRDLEREFEPFLAAFTNYILSIPDEVVTQTLRQVEGVSAVMSEKAWEYKLRTDSVIDWMDKHLIFEECAMTAIGSDKDDNHSLFGNYFQHSLQGGSKPKSSKEFSPYLLELLTTLGLPVEKCRTSSARFIRGVKLRESGDFESPSIIDTARNVEKRVGNDEEPNTDVASKPNAQDLSKADESVSVDSVDLDDGWSDPPLNSSLRDGKKTNEENTLAIASSLNQIAVNACVWVNDIRCNQWKPSTVIQILGNSSNSAKQTTGWKIQFADGFERYIWDLHQMRLETSLGALTA